MTGYIERREARLTAAKRRAEDTSIVVNMILRHIPAIDVFVAALDGSETAPKFVRLLRAELARRLGRR